MKKLILLIIVAAITAAAQAVPLPMPAEYYRNHPITTPINYWPLIGYYIAGFAIFSYLTHKWSKLTA